MEKLKLTNKIIGTIGLLLVITGNVVAMALPFFIPQDFRSMLWYFVGVFVFALLQIFFLKPLSEWLSKKLPDESERLVSTNACEHRFSEEEVLDLNIDPKCIKCGMYFSRIYVIRPCMFVSLPDGVTRALKPVNNHGFQTITKP